MTKKADLLRNQPHPSVFGHELDRATLMPLRRPVKFAQGRDYGCDPIPGTNTYRMVPSGDVVTYAERTRRLAWLHEG